MAIDDPVAARRGAGLGVLARFDRSVDEVIAQVADVVQRGLRRSEASSGTVEFGIKIAGEAGFIVAKTPDEGTFRITLNYDRYETPSPRVNPGEDLP
ncbi:CU044_2847 family protein [Actinoplanes sp. NPDC000266]